MVSPQARADALFEATRAWLAHARRVQEMEARAMDALEPEALAEALRARMALAGELEALGRRWRALRATLGADTTLEDALRAHGDEALLARRAALLAELAALAERERLHLARVEAFRRVGDALLDAAGVGGAPTYGPSGAAR